MASDHWDHCHTLQDAAGTVCKLWSTDPLPFAAVNEAVLELGQALAAIEAQTEHDAAALLVDTRDPLLAGGGDHGEA